MFLYISIKDPFKSTQYTSFATAYASFCHQFFLEAPFISRITSCLTVNNNTYINSLFSKFWAFSQEATSLKGNKTSYTHVNHGWYKPPAKKLFFFFSTYLLIIFYFLFLVLWLNPTHWMKQWIIFSFLCRSTHTRYVERAHLHLCNFALPLAPFVVLSMFSIFG